VALKLAVRWSLLIENDKNFEGGKKWKKSSSQYNILSGRKQRDCFLLRHVLLENKKTSVDDD
jgi:hypothetical protein